MLTAICNAIEKEHHPFIRKNITEIERLLVTLVKSKADTFPFLIRVLKRFQQIADTLAMHILQEEIIILPYIRKLAECASKEIPAPETHFPTLSVPIESLNNEHESAISGLLEIRIYTNNYFVTSYSDDTLGKLYDRLQKFEQELTKILKIEGEILFPKAIKLEAQLNDNH